MCYNGYSKMQSIKCRDPSMPIYLTLMVHNIKGNYIEKGIITYIDLLAKTLWLNVLLPRHPS